jgi:zincin-like metallopeptidase
MRANPVAALKPVKVPPSQTLPFDDDQMTTILYACDRYSSNGIYGDQTGVRLRALTLRMRYSGLRIGDAVTCGRERLVGSELSLFLKGYTVFNVEQIDGLSAQYTAPASPRLDVSDRIARAERFFSAMGATLTHGGNRAFYLPATDSIVLPRFETFRDAESYYPTLAHEMTHWTAHESRLARDFGTKRFGSEGYAIEETRGRTRRRVLLCRS